MSTPLLTRSEIGLRPPLSRSPLNGTELICHYGGPSPWGSAPDRSSAQLFRDTTDHNRCASIWRAYQAYHMDNNGWMDIAYSSGVCPHGVRHEGRGFGIKTAATGDANAFAYATCYIGGDDDPLTDEAKEAYLDESERFGVPIIHVHHDFMSTSCAGPWFDVWKLEGFAPAAGAVTPPQQPPVLPPNPGISTGQGGPMITLAHPLLRDRSDDFWIDPDLKIKHRWYQNGKWSSEEEIPGDGRGLSVSGFWRPDGSILRLVVAGTDGRPYENIYVNNQGWSGWLQMPGKVRK